jgi:ribosome-binding protein aMBF1 (putative translation factor)
MPDIDIKINERLIEARHTLGLSQVEFAENIKISNGYIASIEVKNRRVNDRIIKIVSMTYGINYEWLKNGTGNMFDKVDDFKLEQIIKIFRKLDPSFQDYVLKQFDNLLTLQEIKNGETGR